jgi:hypothetical protein
MAVSVRHNSSNGRMLSVGRCAWQGGGRRAGMQRRRWRCGWRGDGGGVVVRSELNWQTRGATQQGTARERCRAAWAQGVRAGCTAVRGRDYVRSAVVIARAELLLSLGSRMGSFRHVVHGCLACRCFEVTARVDRPPRPIIFTASG